ncbi:MAG: ABC transporter ATP-binding protein [Methyloversatilis discipulorum]|nr:ABC transporter ATP-binding protein [Methyloversatilis discipulorum]
MARKVFAVLDPDQRRSAGGLFLLMLVGMAFETLGVGLVVPAMAVFMQDDSASRSPHVASVLRLLGEPPQAVLVAWAVSALALVYLVKNAFLAFLAWRQSAFAFAAQARVAHKLFARYLAEPYIFHVQHNSAQLIRNVTTEATLFGSHALLPGMLLVAEACVLVGIGTLLLLFEPVGALVVGGVVGGSAWAFNRFTRSRVARWGQLRQHHEGLKLQQIQQGLGGVKDVRVFGREAAFLAAFDQHNDAVAKVGGRQSGLQQMPRLWLELLAVGGLALLVLSMIWRERALADVVPVVGLFAAAAFRLMPSMNRVLTALHGLRYGLPVIDMLHAELTRPQGAEDAGIAGAARAPFNRGIRIDALSYRYPGALVPALDRLSLDIHAGETLGIVGSSGSGKSTLVDLLLGLLNPDVGRIEADGRDIRDDLRGWRSQIGYVPQSIYLTDDSLRRNVAFGVPDAQIDDAAVARALAFAQLDAFVAAQPEGVHTFVGERGVRLSGGQRQRIGIARALYHDPPILVLDEATSALDVATEAEVMKAVAALQGRKTIVIVAHRLSTVEQCDRLCRLEAGRVVQTGVPAEVLDQLVRAADEAAPSLD